MKFTIITAMLLLVTGCASYIDHIKQSSVENESNQVALYDTREQLQRALPYSGSAGGTFTLNGYINPNGTYGGGLNGGF